MHARTPSNQPVSTVVVLMTVIVAGCHGAALPNARGRVSQDLKQRFGDGIAPSRKCDQTFIPFSWMMD